jgi:hypothetical protein
MPENPSVPVFGRPKKVLRRAVEKKLGFPARSAWIFSGNFFIFATALENRNAHVAELVDALVSGASKATCAGSSPVVGTSSSHPNSGWLFFCAPTRSSDRKRFYFVEKNGPGTTTVFVPVQRTFGKKLFFHRPPALPEAFRTVQISPTHV